MKETKKKHLKYITNTFKAIPLFSPPCKEKKPSPSELKVDEQIPNHKNSHNPSQSMKTPLKKSL
jgi:hypothetical protein